MSSSATLSAFLPFPHFLLNLTSLLLAGLLFAPAALSQPGQGTLSGRIQSEAGAPLPGITIAVEGTPLGTTTGEDGAFVLGKVPAGTYVLVVSGVGYQARKENVGVKNGENRFLTLALNESTQSLEEIVVLGTAGAYRTEDFSPSLKIPTPLLETPQQVVSIGQQVIADQQLFNLQEVARNVSGVSNSGQFTPALDIDFSVRGFAANQYRNGLLIPAEDVSPDPVLIERVEFIKGPAGFFVGQGAPGGAVNFVTKKPVDAPLASASLTYGSFNTFRGSVDLGGSLHGNGKLSYRLNALGQEAGHYVRNASTDKYVVAPALRYRLTDKTSLTAEYNYSLLRFDNIYQPSLVIGGAFFTLPRDFSYHHYQESPTRATDQYGALTLEHELGKGWQITGIAGVGGSTIRGSRYVTNRFAAVESATDTLEVIRNYRDAKGQSVAGQLFVTGSVNTGRIKHTLLAGLDATQAENQITNLRFRGPGQVLKIIPADPVFATPPPPFGVDAPYPQFVVQSSWVAAYAYDNAYLLPNLILNLGGRFTSFTAGDNFGGQGLSRERTDAFSPRLGLTYLPVPNVSLFALYDQGFEVNAGVDREGRRFDPSRGNNLEIGSKQTWWGGRLASSVSAFHITKTNVLTQDPDNADFQRAGGEVRSRGVEVDVQGELTPALSLIANYAYLDATTTRDTDPALAGRRADMIPEHTFNAWLKYRLRRGALNGLGLALGTRSERGRVNGFTPERNALPDYTLLDAGLFYQRDKMSLTVNVNNLTDARYALYGQGSPWINVFEGPGRHFKATFGVKF